MLYSYYPEHPLCQSCLPMGTVASLDFLPCPLFLHLLDFIHGILQSEMCVGVKRHADFAVPHEVLERFGVHARPCHVAAVGVAADMGRDVGKLDTENLVVIRGDNVYCKYYEVVYILFHTGMRISEFCGLTIRDIDLENNVVKIDHQLQRGSDMRYTIQPTKTNAGTRRIPITEDVAECFRAILEDREKPRVEKMVDGYTGFLFLDKDGMPLVAMHWEHRFKHMVNRYNEIFRIQLPSITPHVCATWRGQV